MTTRADRLALAEQRDYSDGSLVGSFFHRFTEAGEIDRQGAVVAEPHPGVYLVEFFDWLVGASTDQALIRIETMIDDGWRFYDEAVWMRNASEARR